MKPVLLFLIVILMAFTPPAAQQGEFCGVRNFSWQSGEHINYHVYYTLAGIYVYGGEANFHVNLEQYGNKPVYHLTGDGKTNSFFDGFFKVRDKYESYIDTASLQPYKFVRNIWEGDFKKFESVTFSHTARTATSQGGVFPVPDCVQDVLSAIYYARNIDFNRYKPGDRVPFSMFIDDKTYNLYIRYLGKEVIKTRYGRFEAIKFKPLLIEGTIFSGGEKMVVWVTDDANKIPVRIESPISVGSVKVDMMGYRGLRHPMTALKSRR
ncbi:MAG TPA: DUF3108 domain-containing protein [Lacibacter sp.]|nr:DUF3108 domain-containing protein [Lacibacter sp.]HMO87984.1 DUF3108 domain-containing protein [Lacibacter sp.]HMP87641.1 DUF3108 domain-containing protein [Lacibacter sp.]